MFDKNDNNQQTQVQDTTITPDVSADPAASGVLGPVEDPNAGAVTTPTADATTTDLSSFNTTPVDASTDTPATDTATSDTTTTLPETDVTQSTPAPSQDLLTIKQEALQSLSPLLNHLDQTPEEKFKTTMMMIQASDDQSLVKSAYETAQTITDEKAKAQALLDIVNEINYFTQQAKN